MKPKLYVGNLPYETTSKDLIHLFTEYGEILEAMIIPDKITGKSKGFGFVTFNLDNEAQEALKKNDTEYNGRKLIVQLAHA